jgi:hypothetical protein
VWHVGEETAVLLRGFMGIVMKQTIWKPRYRWDDLERDLE